MKTRKIILFVAPIALYVTLVANAAEAYEPVVFKDTEAFDEACRWELRPRYGENLVPSYEPFEGELTDDKIKRCEFLLEANRPEPEKKPILRTEPEPKSEFIHKPDISDEEAKITELLELIKQLQTLIKLLQEVKALS